MSDLITETGVSDSKDCPASSLKPIHTIIKTHNAQIGDGLTIRRALPTKQRRMIGAWCFLDHFGPIDLHKSGLDIAPHPHMGLQTFTWTLSGEILHCDSLGSKQIIKPGAVNLMTAGQGISHSEQSLPDSILHGVQLWIALPNDQRHMPPEFHHYSTMPTYEQDNVLFTVLAGKLFGLQAPTHVYSPLLGVDLNAKTITQTVLPVQPEFEYGVLVLQGSATIENENIEPGALLYLGCGRKELTINLAANARVIMIGGQPFEEEILVWWNFVARTRDEIIQATLDWNNNIRFGEVTAYQGNRFEAPTVPNVK